MTAAPSVFADNRHDVHVLESLRDRYERNGFTFSAQPSPASLPAFLGAYRPDALAQKPGRNIVIEVVHRGADSADASVSRLRKLLRDQPGWQLDVVLAGDRIDAAIPPASPSEIGKQLASVADLRDAGHARAAFLLAWALLEAASNAGGDSEGHPKTPAELVQELAMSGRIDLATEQPLFELARMRNRVAHGDLSVVPSGRDIDAMIQAAEVVLNA